jgi:hypothetical protein
MQSYFSAPAGVQSPVEPSAGKIDREAEVSWRRSSIPSLPDGASLAVYEHFRLEMKSEGVLLP